MTSIYLRSHAEMSSDDVLINDVMFTSTPGNMTLLHRETSIAALTLGR
jgi:hypothetical protein